MDLPKNAVQFSIFKHAFSLGTRLDAFLLRCLGTI